MMNIPDSSPLTNVTPREQPLIVVAEDVGIQVRLTKLCLEREHYTVLACANGKDALETIQAQLPDLILLDVDMPELNGFQVLDALRRDPATRAIPVIMLTAHAKDAGLFAEWATEADAFMTKPFSPQQLVQTVKQVFAARFSPAD